MEAFIFSLQLVSPVFLIIFLGAFLKKIGIIDNRFSAMSSKLVFNVALPVFIFLKISGFDLKTSFEIKQIILVLLCTLAAYISSWLIANIMGLSPRQKGVFVQGSFRGNFAIVGLAIISNFFSDNIIVQSSILLALIVPLYNILSLVALIANGNEKSKMDFLKIFFEVIKNPLIIGVAAAIPFSLFKIEIYRVFSDTGDYLAALTLPLALLGIGGTMDFSKLKKASGNAVYSSLLKIVLFPAVFTYIAYYFGYRGEQLGMLFILFASPTAIVSFIMANALGGDEKLAGNIIVITTLVSVISLPLGIYLLNYFGLMDLTMF